MLVHSFNQGFDVFKRRVVFHLDVEDAPAAQLVVALGKGPDGGVNLLGCPPRYKILPIRMDLDGHLMRSTFLSQDIRIVQGNLGPEAVDSQF